MIRGQAEQTSEILNSGNPVSDEFIKLCTILERRTKDQEGWPRHHEGLHLRACRGSKVMGD